MLRRAVRVLVGTSLLTGCGQIVVPYGDGSIPGDAIFGSDGGGPDRVPGRDAQPGTDVQFADTPDFFDVTPPRDVPPGVDVPGRDVPVPIDVTPGSIAGVYRCVRYEATDASGVRMMFSDVNTPFMSPDGVSYDVRVNGMLFLTDNRLAESFGILVNDHFSADDNAMDVASAFGAYGSSIPGTLRGNSFTAFSAAVNFGINPDGTIAQRDDMSGTVITWARTVYSTRMGITIQGQAIRWQAMSSMRFVSARAAIAWDRPGISTGVVTTNDTPIAFGTTNTALYDFTVSIPPMESIGSIGGTAVALGYPIVYDDSNRNGRYDAGSDVLRGVGSVAFAWRSGAASTTFARSNLRDIEEGLQLVLVHPDYTIGGRPGVTPFDPTNAAPPDVAVATGPSPIPIHDVIR